MVLHSLRTLHLWSKRISSYFSSGQKLQYCQFDCRNQYDRKSRQDKVFSSKMTPLYNKIYSTFSYSTQSYLILISTNSFSVHVKVSSTLLVANETR
jgi:hypothetical protein